MERRLPALTITRIFRALLKWVVLLTGDERNRTQVFKGGKAWEAGNKEEK